MLLSDYVLQKVNENFPKITTTIDEVKNLLDLLTVNDTLIYEGFEVPSTVLEEQAFLWIGGVGVTVPVFGSHSTILMLLLELEEASPVLEELLLLGDSACDRVCSGNDIGLGYLNIAYKSSVGDWVYVSENFNKMCRKALQRMSFELKYIYN